MPAGREDDLDRIRRRLDVLIDLRLHGPLSAAEAMEYGRMAAAERRLLDEQASRRDRGSLRRR